MRIFDGTKRKLSSFGITHFETVDLEITGLSSDSRMVKPGFLFAALQGFNLHGASYCKEAITRGCIVILTDPEGQSQIKKFIKGHNIKLIVVADPKQIFACCAAIWFNAQPKILTAVTGTNGKTSVANFTRQIWEFLGYRASNIGTLGVEGPVSYPLAHTTPDPIKLHRILFELAEQKVTHACLEASSHGLDQKRLDGAILTSAAFTNLSHDHLDYHKTLDSYFTSKVGLFTRILKNDGSAVLNIDSDWGKKLKGILETYGIRKFTVGKDSSCDLRIMGQKFNRDSQDLKFSFNGTHYHTNFELIGGFQAYNILIAAGLVISSGGKPVDVFDSLNSIKTIKGRMQKVACLSNGASIYVDFAHTPAAIEVAIKSIQRHILGRVSIILGAGGDRDHTKRKLMGEVAQKYADLVYVTDDNPRNEDPKKIRSMIKLGAPKALEIPDRAEAILIGISNLEAGDVLLITGKGHETGQIIGDSILAFDDAEQANIAVAALEGTI